MARTDCRRRGPASRQRVLHAVVERIELRFGRILQASRHPFECALLAGVAIAHHPERVERLQRIGPAALAPRSCETLLEEFAQYAHRMPRVHSSRLDLNSYDLLHRHARIHFEEVVAGFDRELGETVATRKGTVENIPARSPHVLRSLWASPAFCRYRRTIRLDEHASALNPRVLRTGFGAMNGPDDKQQYLGQNG